MKKRVDEMAEVMDNLKVVVVNGADHNSCVSNPKLSGSIQAFLAVHSVK